MPQKKSSAILRSSLARRESWANSGELVACNALRRSSAAEALYSRTRQSRNCSSKSLIHARGGPGRQLSPVHCLCFSLPFGRTVVVGGMGRSEVPLPSFGGEWSFFGFFDILLLRCSPLAMWILLKCLAGM